MIRATFTSDFATKMKARMSPQRMTAAKKDAGRTVAQYLRQYYRAKDKKEPNALGGDRTHFWNQIGQSVGLDVKVAGNVVAIPIRDKRFPQKLYGGPIVPKRAQALTIPVHPAAHGRTAAVIASKVGGLFIVKSGEDAFLANKMGGRLTFYFMLKRRVVQRPWPGSLPSKRGMQLVFARALKREVITRMRRRA